MCTFDNNKCGVWRQKTHHPLSAIFLNQCSFETIRFPLAYMKHRSRFSLANFDLKFSVAYRCKLLQESNIWEDRHTFLKLTPQNLNKTWHLCNHFMDRVVTGMQTLRFIHHASISQPEHWLVYALHRLQTTRVPVPRLSSSKDVRNMRFDSAVIWTNLQQKSINNFSISP